MAADPKPERPRGRDLLLPVAGPLASFLPLYLTASLALSLRADIGLDARRLGLVTSAFFAAGAASSIPTGWLTERFGYVRVMQLAVGLSAVSMLMTALVVRSWTGLLVTVAAAGVAQAVADPAAGAFLGAAVHRRHQGFAFGVKLAALPLASLLCGLAVPLVAAPLGWRAAFVAGALVTLPSLAVTPAVRPPTRRRADGRAPVNAMLVVLIAIGAGIAFAAANTFSAFVVSSASVEGIAQEDAALLVALGAIVGVAGRICLGIRADRRSRSPMRSARNILLAAAVTFGVLAVGAPLFGAAVVIAFVTIWGWSPLFQMAVVSEFAPHGDRPLRTINSVIFVGCIAGPAGFGWLAEADSFQTAWVMSGVVTTVAAILLTAAARTMERMS